MQVQIDIWGNEIENDEMLTYEKKIEQAKDALVLAADISRKYYREPLIITYSGGKDSDVMLDIAVNCLKKEDIEVVNSHTTVDAPQTVRHIEKTFKRLQGLGIATRYVNRYPVEKTMWDLIVKKQMPPTRLMRYCCNELKESSTPNRICAIGVREDESSNRKNRNLFSRGGKERKQWSLDHAHEVFHEAEENDEVFDCMMVTLAKKNEDLVCNPIYKFLEDDVWRYIKENHIEVNPLYEMGYRRVGCILCPLGGMRSMEKEAHDFPKYKQMYINAFERMMRKRKESGKDDVTGEEGYHVWETGEDVYNWWVYGKERIKGQVTITEWLKEKERKEES